MFTCQNKGNYLFAEVSGIYSLEVLISAIHEVADRCQKESLKKVFIDLRNMQGNPSILDRYKLGVEIANVWGPRIKAAAVARAGIIDHMVENTAVNRGAKLKVTADVDEALEWLGVQKNDQT